MIAGIFIRAKIFIKWGRIVENYVIKKFAV